MKNLPNNKGGSFKQKPPRKKVPFGDKPTKSTSMRKVIADKKEKEKRSSFKEELLNGLDPITTWMDAQQIMQEFNISARTLQNWRTRKKIPYCKHGKKILYNRTLFEKMLLRNIVIDENFH